jgi:hypothetical protein
MDSKVGANPTVYVIRTSSATEGRVHLAHDPAAVDLIVFSAAPSAPAICLFSIPFTTRASTWTLARRQGRQAALDRRPLRLDLASLAALGQRALTTLEQRLALEGLLEEIERAFLHRAHAHRTLPRPVMKMMGIAR